MAPRTVKGVRLLSQDLAVVNQLLRRFPSYRNESNLLSEACRRGLRELALEAGAAATPPYAGVDVTLLVDEIERAVVLYTQFLAAQGRLALPVAPVVSPTAALVQRDYAPPIPPVPPPLQIDISAGDDVMGMSGGFLDDDE